MASLKRDWSLSNRLVQFYLDNYKYSKNKLFSLKDTYRI